MNYLRILNVSTLLFQLLVELSQVCAQNKPFQTTSIPKQNKTHPYFGSGGPFPFGPGGMSFNRSIDFTKLKLDISELFGSRWAIEQKVAIDVSHAIEIDDAVLLDDNQLSLRVQFHLRQKWLADGLQFPVGLFKENDSENVFITAEEKVLKHMWCPDSYISTSRESNMNVGTIPSLVYIFQNRTIVFKMRMFAQIGCSSNFKWYPLDVQTCDLVVESYKYDTRVVRYIWEDDRVYRPVMVKIKRLLQYDLRLPFEHMNGSRPRGGRGVLYPFVKVTFTFERKLGNNIIQVYTPTVLVVVLSWFSFWLGLDAIPGRISLLVTCMLTLVTMHSGLKSSIPPVHYITMMDIWLVGCMAFVFFAICEFVIVKYLHWRHQQRQKAKRKKFRDQYNEKLESCVNFVQNAMANSAHKLSNSKIKTDDNLQMTFATRSHASTWERIPQPQQMAPSDILSFMVGAAPNNIFQTNRSTTRSFTDEDERGTEPEEYDESLIPIHTKQAWVLLDRVCRGLFPFLFAMFNAIYWPVLFQGSAIQV